MPRIEPRTAGSGRKNVNHCAMLPPAQPNRKRFFHNDIETLRISSVSTVSSERQFWLKWRLPLRIQPFLEWRSTPTVNDWTEGKFSFGMPHPWLKIRSLCHFSQFYLQLKSVGKIEKIKNLVIKPYMKARWDSSAAWLLIICLKHMKAMHELIRILNIWAVIGTYTQVFGLEFS